jgi:hypothetical protein
MLINPTLDQRVVWPEKKNFLDPDDFGDSGLRLEFFYIRAKIATASGCRCAPFRAASSKRLKE